MGLSNKPRTGFYVFAILHPDASIKKMYSFKHQLLKQRVNYMISYGPPVTSYIKQYAVSQYISWFITVSLHAQKNFFFNYLLHLREKFAEAFLNRILADRTMQVAYRRSHTICGSSWIMNQDLRREN